MTLHTLRRSTAIATIALCLAAPAALAGVPQLAPPEAPGSPLHAIAYSSTVFQIQQGLTAQGFDAGPSDGLMGSRTRSAITAYQQRNGLLVTGQPSQSLLEHIRSNASRSAAPDTDDDRNLVRTQRALRRLGYDVSATGRVDAQTRAAIRAYERDNDLLVTGQFNEALVAHLRDNMRDARRGDDTAVSAAALADIQRGLRARGYDIDSASGSMDDKTAAAIRAYERDSGLRETGEPSRQLANALQEGLTPAASTPANIRAVQRALNDRGYSAGPVDGVLGPSTRSAIQQFRTSSDLSASGGVDHELLAALGIGAAAGASTGSTGSTSTDATYRQRMGDDFNDGNFQSNPGWDVIAGQFQVENGTLRSSIDTRQTQQTQQEMGREVIQGVLGQVLGMPTGASDATNAAAIAQDSNFGNAFKISVRISGTPQGTARMNFGPYQGRNVGHGYRLAYDAEASRPLSIIAATAGGTRTVVASSSAPNLADGQWHKLSWSRDADGQMLVTIDDAPYLSATDRGLEGGNEGFSFVNLGGAWQIDDIGVDSPQG